ncbi:MAG: alpha/beta fold hydrolase [Acidimicrobiia bacterium]|nr:alpha/beta fold hydrolase [Acidimicrobiia bacterium]
MTTFVLVHGAYQGGWIWQLVAERLEAGGHRVYRPTLDGCGERSQALRTGINTEVHGDELAQLLFYEDLSDVALVGTSSGGMVVCRTAEQARERIARLVFVDALALLDGERVGDIVDRPGGTATGLAVGPTREDAEARLFNDLEPALRTWTLDRMTMHPADAIEQPVSLGDFWDHPWSAHVIYCRRSSNPPEPHQRRTAARLGARWDELDTGHYPMLSAPAELAALLDDENPEAAGRG